MGLTISSRARRHEVPGEALSPRIRQGTVGVNVVLRTRATVLLAAKTRGSFRSL